MAFKMRGFPMQQTSALKQTDDDWDKLSDEEKNKAMQQGVKEEEEAHAAYHGAPGTKSEQSIVQDESALGKNIEGQLNKAKGPGGTTNLPKVRYEQLVNKLESIYKAMYPGEPVNLGFGPWKPSK